MKIKRNTIIIAVIIFIILFGLFAIYRMALIPYEQGNRKRVLVNIGINGIVDSVFYNHGTVFVIKNEDSLFSEHRLSEIFKKNAEAGDSIYKLPGDTMIQIRKPDGKVMAVKFLMDEWR